jgi:N-acetylmuramic acid 6-phosphate etherase
LLLDWISRPSEDIAAILIDGQVSAAQATSTTTEVITAAAYDMANSIRTDGALYYVAAGSSGLMAAADAMELGGTFGHSGASGPRSSWQAAFPHPRICLATRKMRRASLATDLAKLSKRDTIIVVSASGSTPFTLEAARLGKEAGTTVIAIANNPDAPLFALSKHAIYLPTAPEVVSGSTRMGAGTAQKITLNALSTLMALNLGHIYDGMMVNLRADNIKLRDRAERMVATITGASDGDAAGALKTADGNIKTALPVGGWREFDRARNQSFGKRTRASTPSAGTNLGGDPEEQTISSNRGESNMKLRTLGIALASTALMTTAAMAEDVTLTIESWRTDDLTLWQDKIIPAFERPKILALRSRSLPPLRPNIMPCSTQSSTLAARAT